MVSIIKVATIRIITLFGFISNTYGIETSVLSQPTSDMAKYGSGGIIGKISILDLISLINSYLWFAIGFFCFVFMIWNGYKLIMANGDSKSMDSAKKALLGSAIGLAVCLLAYIIVNLAVKLFA